MAFLLLVILAGVPFIIAVLLDNSVNLDPDRMRELLPAVDSSTLEGMPMQYARREFATEFLFIAPLFVSVVVAVVFIKRSRQWSRATESGRWYRLLITLGCGLVGALLIANFLAVLAWQLASWGVPITDDPPTELLRPVQLWEHLLFAGTQSVPLVDIDRSLGWREPIPDPDYAFGLEVIAFRLVVIFGVVAIARQAWTSAPSTDGVHGDSAADDDRHS